MLHINPGAAPFALTADNKVPEAIRDTAYWDDNGDVLLVTKDGVALLLRMKLLLRYSETIRSLIGHIAGMPQDGLWTPILELECNAAELRTVVEYLQLQEQYVPLSIQTCTLSRQLLRMCRGIQPSIDSLARCAFSAYTLGIKVLDEAALTGLLTCTRDRLDAYANWDGFTEFRPPPVKPVHAVLAGRALPEPASSILSVAFVDLSAFGLEDETALYPQIDAANLRGPHDEDTIALLRERNAEFVDSLLKLSTNFGRRRSLAKIGRPCCNFEAFAADHTPDPHANHAAKGRFALSIIATLGAELEKARFLQAISKNAPAKVDRRLFEHDDKSRCSSCLAELHHGMMRLYGQWWEDVGQLLMGDSQGGRSSVWDDIRDSLSVPKTLVPPPGWLGGLRRFLCRIYGAVVDLQFRQ
jgi:hypothetical protein